MLCIPLRRDSATLRADLVDPDHDPTKRSGPVVPPDIIEHSLHDAGDVLVPVDINLGFFQPLPVLLDGNHQALAHGCPPISLRLNRGDDQPRGALSQLAVAQTIVRPRSPDLGIWVAAER